MHLRQALQRENNNFDCVRLLAAMAVIYGHANALVPESQAQSYELITVLIRTDYSGSLAVKLFFFLSGLVVSNSLLEKKSPLQFVLARIFRIWPAFLATLIIMALLAGPWLSTLAWPQYFSQPATWAYIVDGARLNIQYQLPGVFSELRAQAVNGSLWTIPYEVTAYAVLLALFVLRVHVQRWFFCLLVLALCAASLLPEDVWLGQSWINKEVLTLTSCFFIGSLAALFKDVIRVQWPPVLMCLGLFLAFRRAPWASYFFYLAIFGAAIYVSTRSWMTSWQLPADISFGVYLWGWPVQQALVYGWPELNLQTHRLMAVIGACILGALSWYLLERPAIAAGRAVYGWCSQRAARLKKT